MFIKLDKSSKEKIEFFDAILKYLSVNYSRKVNFAELKENIPYSDDRIKNLSKTNDFFAFKENTDETYQKSLNLLLDSGHIVQDIEQYSLTVLGLVSVTSNGFLGREKREIKKYNYQNFIWLTIALTFIINLVFQSISYAKLSESSHVCNCHTIQQHSNKSEIKLPK